MRRVLVVGGAGYLGTHTLISLAEAGYSAVVFDSLVNSKAAAISRVEALCGAPIPFVIGDIRDPVKLDGVFDKYGPFTAVIHFAGLKAVGESTKLPLLYYENNVVGTIRLLEAMTKHDCKSIIFSSSATVYGDPEEVPITEDMKVQSTNPYGRTKSMIEVW
jgi:UDP-glucose 4-epimerase